MSIPHFSQKIFCYGSLRTDLYNYNKYLIGRVSNTTIGTIKGELYQLKGKNYPALLKGSNDIIGEIMTLTGDLKTLWEQLDSLENYYSNDDINNEYHKKNSEVFNMETQTIEILPVYFYNDQNPKANLSTMIKIPCGDWKIFLEESIKISL